VWARNKERRGSRKWLPSPGVGEYLEFLDLTAPHIGTDERGAMPANLKPSFERLKSSTELWIGHAVNFRTRFRTRLGRPKSIATHADALDHNRAISFNSLRRVYHSIHQTSPNALPLPILGTSIARRWCRHSQVKNFFFSQAGQGLISSNPNRIMQFSRGHLDSPDETALAADYQSELATLRNPFPQKFFIRRTLFRVEPENELVSTNPTGGHTHAHDSDTEPHSSDTGCEPRRTPLSDLIGDQACTKMSGGDCSSRSEISQASGTLSTPNSCSGRPAKTCIPDCGVRYYTGSSSGESTVRNQRHPAAEDHYTGPRARHSVRLYHPPSVHRAGVAGPEFAQVTVNVVGALHARTVPSAFTPRSQTR
jgi:hypothetical protein